MLRIHPVTSSAGAKSYYQAGDYYSEGQELAGVWGGILAKRFGLEGMVDQEQFEHLCDNLHPMTGQQLTPRMDSDRRVGYDLVFSAPKSFSVLEALIGHDEAGDNQLRQFFLDAVRETMAEDIEPDMMTRNRKGGADGDRRTGNLAYALFDHGEARPVPGQTPDMHRHAHVLCFNATFDETEQRVKAGQFGDIKRDGEYYTARFYSRLATKLENAGYRIDRQGGKEWQILGVPKDILERFSKRTGEVEDADELRRKNDPNYWPETKHKLGAKTRSKKAKELSPEALRSAWDAQISPEERSQLARVHRGEIAPGPEVTAKEAMAFAIAHCFERLSVVPEREIKRVALLHGLGCVTLKEVDAELPAQGVITREKNGRMLSTTRQALAEERFYAGLAADGLGTVKPVGVPETLTRGRLNDGQWQAVTGLLRSSSRISMVEGPAGTGKSTMLEAFDRGMRLSGKPVTYLATTTAAVDVLRKDGFQAETVAHFLLSEKMQKAAAHGHVVVDESSLLSHKDAYRLFQAVKSYDLRLTLLGDPMQHGPVAAGATLKVLADQGGLKPFRLNTIQRQKSHLYRAAVKSLSEGRTLEGFDQLDRLGYIRENREGDRYHAIGAEYLQALEDKKSVLVVSPTHLEGQRINDEIRRQLRHAGKIGKEEHQFTRLVATNLTEAERGDARLYAENHVLQFHQHAKGHASGSRLTFDGSDAARATLPVKEAAKFQAYRQEQLSLAKGDLLRFTANVKSLDKKHKINNGSVYKIEAFTPGGNIRLENGWIVAADTGHFMHGYVSTSFGSQGRTVDRVIIGQAASSLPASNREQIYVSASRARERMTLFTDDKAAIRDGILRSSAKLSASELVTPEPQTTRWDVFRRQAARLRHLTLLTRVRQAFEPMRMQPEQERSYGR